MAAPSSLKVAVGPVLVGPDDIARVIELPDGSGRVETWDGSAWVAGGSDCASVLVAPEWPM